MSLMRKSKVKQRKPVLTLEEKEEFGKYTYPFKNIALEGGGGKGYAYLGVFRMLEEIGAFNDITRFCGTSAGALGSMWVALGYNSYELEAFLSENISKKCYDARFGAMSFMYNMKKHYGWHPGNRLLKWLGKHVSAKLGDPDATFADLYQKTGRELCIVVVNVSQLDCEYCHVKTTPNMPIRIAVRMSMSIPGVIAPVKYNLHGTEELFCDGGLICNYPVHAFDGWYLSLKPENNFLRRIADLNDVGAIWDTGSKFGTEPNKETLGVLLYADAEREMFRIQLDKRAKKYVSNPTPIPATKLARKRLKNKQNLSKISSKHEQLSEAMLEFLHMLKESDVDDSGSISREELKHAFEKAGPTFTNEKKKLLFGKDTSTDELFDSLDIDGNGEISMGELTMYAEQQGMKVRTRFRGFESRPLTSVSGFLDAIVETLLLNMKRIFYKKGDLVRTIGIDTGYLDTLDFNTAKADREFMLQQGKVACIAFLRNYIDEHRQTETKEDVLSQSLDQEDEERSKVNCKDNNIFK